MCKSCFGNVTQQQWLFSKAIRIASCCSYPVTCFPLNRCLLVILTYTSKPRFISVPKQALRLMHFYLHYFHNSKYSILKNVQSAGWSTEIAHRISVNLSLSLKVGPWTVAGITQSKDTYTDPVPDLKVIGHTGPLSFMLQPRAINLCRRETKNPPELLSLWEPATTDETHPVACCLKLSIFLKCS